MGAIAPENDQFIAIAQAVSHGRIFQEIERQIADGPGYADSSSLCAVLAPSFPNDPEPSCVLDEVGRCAYLVQLEQQAADSSSISEAARAIRDAWFRRQLIDIGEELQRLGEGVVDDAFVADQNRDGEQQVEDLVGRLSDLLTVAGGLLIRRRQTESAA